MGRPRTIKQLHPDLLAALRTLSSEVPATCTPAEAWKWVRPITNRGVEFLPQTFWRILSDNLHWRNDITDASAQHIARWINLRRENAMKAGRDWPPTPVTRAFYAQPMPWDGKGEKRASI